MTTHFVRKIAIAAAMACTVPMASAAVLTFDDLPGSLSFFTSDYNGFRFGTNDIQTTAWFYTTDVNTFYGPHSGATYVATDFQLYNGSNLFEAAQPISRTLPFTFDGAWFTGGEQVRYQLYLNSVLVYTSPNSPVLTNVPTFVSSGYALPVTSVVIVGRQGYYAMDDFTYNTAVIPEPSSYALMLAGIAAVGAVARRRRPS